VLNSDTATAGEAMRTGQIEETVAACIIQSSVTIRPQPLPIPSTFD
jgi:hypothetical protein